jgi:hemerythrin-like metal-binding protein
VSSEDYYYYIHLNPDLIRKTKNIWDQFKLSLDNKIIDLQHIWLVYLIHQADYLANISRGMDNFERHKELKGIINECYKYTQEHFKVEEVLIRLSNHKVENHLGQHRHFLKQVLHKMKEVQGVWDEEIFSLANATHNLLRDWLLEHIAIYDRDYSARILKIKNGPDIIKDWLEQIKASKILNISARQMDLYQIVVQKDFVL